MSEHEIRAGDADRERVVTALSAHAAAGRLDAEELEERTAAALEARTFAQLEALTADLPAQRPVASDAATRPRRAPRRGRHGLRVYVATMVLLVAIWALTGMGYFWPVWPALGWGVALLGPGSCGMRGHRRAHGHGHGHGRRRRRHEHRLTA